ncbi:MAG: tetratricopeptide repeat protein [Acidobacteriota bacterium]
MAALLLCCTPLCAANWRTLTAPGFELYTDTSDRSVTQMLERLAQIRRVLPEIESPGPVTLRIFLFDKQRDYAAFAPSGAAGFYQTGFERDYIALPAGSTLPRVVVHEYVHFALRRGSPGPRPAWLEEGLAEFYSNAEVTRNRARIGAPILEHLSILASKEWLTAEQLESSRGSPIFYAQSWALVHMLRSEPQFPERITARHLEALKRYLPRLRTTSIDLAPAAPALQLRAEPIPALEALLVQGELALRTNHVDFAGTFYEQAARDYPNAASASLGLGILARARGRTEEARGHLQRALVLNDRDAMTWFQWAVLENDHAALEKAARLNPNFGEARSLLGVRATDDGDLPAALEHLQQAARLLPRKSYVWYSLAFAQFKAGQPEPAATSLESALRTATSPEQIQMAQTLLDSLRR